MQYTNATGTYDNGTLTIVYKVPEIVEKSESFFLGDSVKQVYEYPLYTETNYTFPDFIVKVVQNKNNTAWVGISKDKTFNPTFVAYLLNGKADTLIKELDNSIGSDDPVPHASAPSGRGGKKKRKTRKTRKQKSKTRKGKKF